MKLLGDAILIAGSAAIILALIMWTLILLTAVPR